MYRSPFRFSAAGTKSAILVQYNAAAAACSGASMHAWSSDWSVPSGGSEMRCDRHGLRLHEREESKDEGGGEAGILVKKLVAGRRRRASDGSTVALIADAMPWDTTAIAYALSLSDALLYFAPSSCAHGPPELRLPLHASLSGRVRRFGVEASVGFG